MAAADKFASQIITIMGSVIIREARIVNRGQIIEGDVWIRDGVIERIGSDITAGPGAVEEVSLNGRFIIPGVIDDQVHFREPGLTHKATICSESAAGLAGGVTSFMEMPNTTPPALTRVLLEDKYRIAAQSSPANYAFYLGASNQNYEELARADYTTIPGIKAFLGSSTGNLLVDNEAALDRIFSITHALIATHCEDEPRVQANAALWRNTTAPLPADIHAQIRDHEACLLSSRATVERARRLGSRLHILHLTTADELSLFEPGTYDPVHRAKRVTAEVCVHHLHFDDRAYPALGNLIKCNPAIKTLADRSALWEALLDGRLDVIATDHAPHTWEEKQQPYWKAPAGLPLIGQSLILMLHYVEQGALDLGQLVDKMCHKPAQLFRVRERGFIEEGYRADLVELVKEPFVLTPKRIREKCGWSPLEGMSFPWQVGRVWVNGGLAAENGRVIAKQPGARLSFDLHD